MENILLLAHGFWLFRHCNFLIESSSTIRSLAKSEQSTCTDLPRRNLKCPLWVQGLHAHLPNHHDRE